MHDQNWVASRTIPLCPLRLGGAALALLVMGCGDLSPGAQGSPRSVVAALATTRFTTGRLSLDAPSDACDPEAAAPRAALRYCGDWPSADAARDDTTGRAQLAALTAAFHRAHGGDPSPDARRADALLELRWASTRPAGIDRAVRLLEGVARDRGDESAWNDLAVAHLAAAEASPQLRPLLQSLEAVERSLEGDRAFVPALFNRALVLDRLALGATAELAWAEYLANESDAGWRREGRARLDRREPGAGATSRTSPEAKLAPDALDAQNARERALALFGEWGDARARGDASAASARLQAIGAIAADFTRAEGDQSVALGLAAITDATLDDTRTAALARGHSFLARGLELHLRAAFDDAIPLLTRAEVELRHGRSPAAGWASYYRGAALVYRGDYEVADEIFRSLAATTGDRQPALLGKATWMIGVSQIRRGAFERAIDAYRASRPHFERAKEGENVGAVSYLIAEALSVMGEWRLAEDEALQGLRRLAAYRRSSYRTMHTVNVAALARRQGLHRAALAVMDEALAAAQARGLPQTMALVFVQRAHDQLALQRKEAARHDVDSAAAWAQRINAGAGRARWTAEAQLARAVLERGDRPQLARAVLDSAITLLRALRTDSELAHALHQRALISLALTDSVAARRYLDDALEALDRQQVTLRSPDVRIAVSATTDNIFDLAMELDVAAGRERNALRVLEQARASAWSQPVHEPVHEPVHDRLAGQDAEPVGALDVTSLAAPGRLVLVYAVLPGHLLTWALTSGGSRFIDQAIPRDSLRGAVDGMLRGMREDDKTGNAAATALHDLLLAPFRTELARVDEVVVVPDRELGRLPFAALRDRATGRLALETQAFVTVPSLDFHTRVSRVRLTHSPRRALVVGDPSLDSASSAELGSLPGARREGEGVARALGVKPLLGEAARRSAVQRALLRASVFHFAGHAVTNGERPQSSYLALAPETQGGDGRWTAEEIAKLRLSNLSLVVLSACRTQGGGEGRATAIAGLAYSFLRAGAPATVSTLWDVGDAEVGDLVLAFHQHVVAGRPPAQALRQAQLQAMQEMQGSRGRGTVRGGAWAAFIYAGK